MIEALCPVHSRICFYNISAVALHFGSLNQQFSNFSSRSTLDKALKFSLGFLIIDTIFCTTARWVLSLMALLMIFSQNSVTHLWIIYGAQCVVAHWLKITTKYIGIMGLILIYVSHSTKTKMHH